MKDKDTRYSVGRDGLLMDWRDAHKRHTRALALRGALIHTDTHITSNQKYTHTRKNRDKHGWGKKSNCPNSSPCFHWVRHTLSFSVSVRKKTPSPWRKAHQNARLPATEALRQTEKRLPPLQQSYFVKTDFVLTWSGSHTPTLRIPCFLTRGRCHALPLLPTFNDIVSSLQG